MFKKIINKTFGLRDGEIYISFLMQLYIFLIISVLLIVKPTVNSLFLSRLGADQLPYGYLLVALAAVITTYFYSKAIRRFSLLKVTIISLIFFSTSFILLSVLLEYQILTDWLLYVYYLSVSLFAVVCTSQFWILANMVYNAREGKRLFGFIGAGAIAGGIFGGYLTSILVSAYGNKVVILTAAALILCCIPIIQKIWKLRVRKLNSYIRKQRKFNDVNAEETSIKLISKSKHLTYLALATGIGVIVAKLVDFQFSDFAIRAITDPDKLTSFFAFWFSSFNVLAFAIQLFFTNRVISKLGVSSSLLILPVGIALGSLLFLTFPELWVLVIIKGIDGSFKQSINKAAVELSIMPIPFHIKNQAKSFIDVAVDSIATGISGFMLIFLIKQLGLSTSYITVIIMLFVIVWILMIYKLREAYFNSFRTNIQRTLNKGVTTESANSILKETTFSAAARIFSGGDIEDILIVLDRLNSYKIKALKPNIINLLDHPSHLIKAEAIKHLYSYDKGTALKRVEQLIYEEDDELVYAALNYIINHSHRQELSFFQNYLDHENEYINGAALLCLAEESFNNKHLAIKYGLEERIEKEFVELSSPEGFTRKENISKLLITIAYSGLLKYYPFISIHLNNKDPYIVAHSLKAAGITSDDRFIAPILMALVDEAYRKTAMDALKKYGPGITKTILAFDKTDDINTASMQYLPSVVESFNTQSSVNVLIRLARSKDVSIRLEASKSLSNLKSGSTKLFFSKRIIISLILKETKYFRRTLDAIASFQHIINSNIEENNLNDGHVEIMVARRSVIELLEQQLEISLKCLFKLMCLVYDESDIEVSYSGLLSDIKEARVNALEFLDNLLIKKVKIAVFPLIEHYVVKENHNNASSINLKVSSERSNIKFLLRSRGKNLKLEILNLIKHLNDKSYVPVVNPLKKHRSKEVKFFVYDTIDAISGIKR